MKIEPSGYASCGAGRGQTFDLGVKNSLILLRGKLLG